MSTLPMTFDYHTALEKYDETSGATTDARFETLKGPTEPPPKQPFESVTSTIKDFASADYALTWQRVQDLRENSEDEDDVAPSDACFDTIFSLIDMTAQKLGLRFPRGSASVGPGPSIRITWKTGEREVRLAASDNPGGSYVYLDSGERYALSRKLNADALISHLQWLSQAS